MRAILTSVTFVLLAGLLSACATTESEPNPWGGLSPDEAHYLGDGSSIEVSSEGMTAVHVRVTDGHLYLNDEDLGEYDKSQAVHFRPDGALSVDGQVRGRIEPARD